jgi:hypothetical protein
MEAGEAEHLCILYFLSTFLMYDFWDKLSVFWEPTSKFSAALLKGVYG